MPHPGDSTGLDWMSRKFATLTGINRWNTNLKRAMATIITQEVIDGARKMARAADLVDRGMKDAKAFAKVGLAPEDASRLGRLGFNADRSRRLMGILDQHGRDFEGNRVTSAHKDYISPEYGRWWKADRDLFETLTYAINSETQNVIIEPKIASRPLMMNTWLGRAVFQFSSFANAWGLQTAPLIAQRPGYEIGAYMGVLVGLGAMVDALHNQLSGRRNIEDTIALWQKKPAGMLYGAINRSGLTGWLARPLGMLEQTPFGIAKRLGNERMSPQYTQPATVTGQLGPFFGWADSLAQGAQRGLFTGDWSTKTQRQLWAATPYRNIWFLEMFNRLAEAAGYTTPIGPAPSEAGKDRP